MFQNFADVEWVHDGGRAPGEDGKPATGRDTRINMSLVGCGDHQLWVYVDAFNGQYVSNVKDITVYSDDGLCDNPTTATQVTPTTTKSATQVGEGAPTITITRPKPGKKVELHKEFRAIVKAYDSNGDIPDTNVLWYSDSNDTDGKTLLTNGNGLVGLKAEAIGLGSHEIWVEVTNQQGFVRGGSSSVPIEIIPTDFAADQAGPGDFSPAVEACKMPMNVVWFYLLLSILHTF